VKGSVTIVIVLILIRQRTMQLKISFFL